MHTLAVDDGLNVLTLGLFLVVSLAVASVVDSAARRRHQATVARAEANTLGMLNRTVLRGEYDVPRLLELVRETFGAESAELVPPDHPVPPGDSVAPATKQSLLVLHGASLGPADQRILAAFAGHVGVLREREELARQTAAARELEAGNRTRTALLAAVSHDLRTPLAGVQAAAETLRLHDERLAPEDRADLLLAIEESTGRLTAIVSDLLDMSRLQTGAVQPVLSDVSLDEVVRAALVGLPDDGRVRTAGPLPMASADAGLLERVLANLLGNALRHTDGAVEVSGSTVGHRVRLCVADHGRGVPPEQRHRMFEPFQRLGDSASGDGVGPRPRRGPRAGRGAGRQPGRHRDPRRRTDHGGRAGGGGMRILLVEDDPTLRRTLAIGLRAEGHEVLTAGDGRTALAAAREDDPQLMVLDLGLPDISGVEVLTRLRGWTQLPVIVLSARSDSTDKVDALDRGADDYVTKPFGMEELLARIRATGRRSGTDLPAVTAGDLRIDVAAREATRAGTTVRLTPTEWQVLEVLLRNPGRLVPRADLLHEVWGPGYDRETNYLRTYLGTLRKKLEADPGRPEHLITEPGIGYRFVLGAALPRPGRSAPAPARRRPGRCPRGRCCRGTGRRPRPPARTRGPRRPARGVRRPRCRPCRGAGSRPGTSRWCAASG